MTTTRTRLDQQSNLTLGSAEFEYDEGVHGWTIKTTETHKISVCVLLYHFRVAMTKHTDPWGWEHGWCYSNPDQPSDDLTRAVIAALAWDPDTEPEPFGWSKRACHCVRELAW